MNFLERIGQAASGAAEKLTEKTRRSAALNRLRAVISAQEKAADKEYLALGRYYYHNLRDPKDPLTEAHCAELDHVNDKLDRALTALENFYHYDGPTAVIFAEKEEVTVEDVQRFDFDPSQAIESVKEAAGAVGPVINEIKEKAAPIVDAAKEKAAPVINEIKEKAVPILDAAKEKAAPVVESVKEKIIGVGKEAEETVEEAAEAVEEAAGSAQETARETEAKLYSKIEPKVEKATEPGENDDLPFEG